MADTPVTLIPGTLPDGYCFRGYQILYNDFFNLGTAFLAGQYRTYNYGNSEPVANDRDKPWRRLNVDGSPDRWYDYFNGEWVAPYEVPASSDERRIWVGAAVDLESYDGGSAGAVTATTGPFWEVDTDFAQRVPLGVGTLPLSGTVVNVGDTGGVDQVTLTTAQMPSHLHTISNAFAAQVGAGGGAIVGFAGTGTGVVATSPVNTNATGGGQPHSNIPPYIGVYFIKRTARIYRTP